MTKIKESTVKGQKYWDMYWNAFNEDNYSLDDVYGKYSVYKARAFNDIETRMNNQGGYGLVVISAGSSFFSTAYRLKDGLVVDTASNTYIVQ